MKIDNSFEGLRDCLLAPQSIDEISEGVKLLQKGFTTDRDKSIENYLSDPKLVSAYTAFYLPSNLKKVRFFIDQNFKLLNSLENIQFIDLGCGPGTISLGWMESFSSKVSEWVFLDRSQLMLDQAKKIQESFFPNSRCLYECVRSEKELALNEVGTRVLALGNSINEMGLDLTLRYIKKIDPDFIFILSPGSPACFDSLIGLKEKLTSWNTFYPCPSDKPTCPMQKGDWCHQVIRVKNLPEISRIAQKVKIDRRTLPFIAHGLSKGSYQRGTQFRVVQFLGKNKAAYRWRVCQQGQTEQIIEVEILKKSIPKEFDIESLEVGSLLDISLVKELSSTKFRAQINY